MHWPPVCASSPSNAGCRSEDEVQHIIAQADKSQTELQNIQWRLAREERNTLKHELITLRQEVKEALTRVEAVGALSLPDPDGQRAIERVQEAIQQEAANRKESMKKEARERKAQMDCALHGTFEAMEALEQEKVERNQALDQERAARNLAVAQLERRCSDLHTAMSSRHEVQEIASARLKDEVQDMIADLRASMGKTGGSGGDVAKLRELVAESSAAHQATVQALQQEHDREKASREAHLAKVQEHLAQERSAWESQVEAIQDRLAMEKAAHDSVNSTMISRIAELEGQFKTKTMETEDVHRALHDRFDSHAEQTQASVQEHSATLIERVALLENLLSESASKNSREVQGFHSKLREVQSRVATEISMRKDLALQLQDQYGSALSSDQLTTLKDQVATLKKRMDKDRGGLEDEISKLKELMVTVQKEWTSQDRKRALLQELMEREKAMRGEHLTSLRRELEDLAKTLRGEVEGLGRKLRETYEKVDGQGRKLRTVQEESARELQKAVEAQSAALAGEIKQAVEAQSTAIAERVECLEILAMRRGSAQASP